MNMQQGIKCPFIKGQSSSEIEMAALRAEKWKEKSQRIHALVFMALEMENLVGKGRCSK